MQQGDRASTLAATVARLRGPLDLARMRFGGMSDPAVMGELARTVAHALGYATCVINLHRPAWDDFQVVAVHGPEEARDALLGQTTSRERWMALLDPRFERFGAYFLPHDQFDWPPDEDEVVYVPDFQPYDDPDAWHPEDALFVPLRGAEDELIGVVSVDEPASGRRPTDEHLEFLSAVASHVALAITAAQERERLHRHQAALDHLLRVSAQLDAGTSPEEILYAVCRAVQEALGFERVAAFLTDRGEDWLRARAEAGWQRLDRLEAGLSMRAMEPLFRPEYEHEGCYLVPGEHAMRLVPSDHRLHSSRRNGRGPRAWDHHWLVVPLRNADESVVGLLWADDPASCMLPTRATLQALRVFANQATRAVESARQMELLRYLAEHDPLTGLRNRRDLRTRIDAEIDSSEAPVSLLLLDLDHFKTINDRLGHDAGDRTLTRFAALLRETARSTDIAARLGGEEFALVLPATDTDGALVIAERLRGRMPSWFADDVPDLTVSVGIATSGRHADDAPGLLAAADRALYVAKLLGRNRSIIYDAGLARRVHEAGTGARPAEQLAAVLMLAETLDMRDSSTARHSATVGRYAEMIARRLGWGERRVERTRVAGILHDVGKVGVSDTVLNKPGPLDDAEWAQMRRHCELGAHICAGANLPDIASWVLAHHERMDGNGYPHGLADEEIPLEARILSVADAYEAMTADRPYRAALPAQAAREELLRHAGSQFDGRIVEAFLAALDAEQERAAATAA